jgi:multiple sugar transport system substrate-binding protein
MKLKKILAAVMVFAMAMSLLAGCGNGDSKTSGEADKEADSQTGGDSSGGTDTEPVELNFLYWADGTQKELIEKACASYEEETGVHINAEALPADETFETYILARKEAGNLPDVSYMGETEIMKYNEMGILSDIDDLFETGKIPDKLDAVTIRDQEGKIIGVGLSNQLVLLYYNKDMFDAADIDYPSADVSKAWSWEEFIEIAQKLTVDVNGKNATEDGFDPDRIQTYGIGFNCLCAFHQFWALNANGGGVVSADGKEFLWDSDKSIEGLQKLVDLVYKYHVASPALYTFNSSIGSVDATIGSGGYAMYTNGSWDLGNLSAIEGINVGVGVLPGMEKAVTMNCGAPMVVYNTSEHLEEAKAFYAYMIDPSKNMELLKSGAWLPNQADYYTDQTLIDEWTSELPEDARDTILSYSSTEGAIAQWPAYYVPAYNKMNTEYTKYIDQALGGEKSVRDVFAECMPTIKEMFESGTVE